MYNARSHNSWVVLIQFLLPAAQIGEICLWSFTSALSPQFYFDQIIRCSCGPVHVSSPSRRRDAYAWDVYGNTIKMSGVGYWAHTSTHDRAAKRPIWSALSIEYPICGGRCRTSSLGLKWPLERSTLIYSKRSAVNFNVVCFRPQLAFPSAMRIIFTAATATCTWTIFLSFARFFVRRTRFSDGQ